MIEQNVPAFERYREIIPNYPEFLNALAEPLPVAVRVNTLKIGNDSFPALMARRGYNVEPIHGIEEAFILRGVERPGHTLEYFLGLYHIQALTSMLPPKIFSPQPGERILDLCAAPGGKTTHLAQLTQNRALLVANEPHPGRMNILRSHADRLGATSVFISRYDGCSFPKRMRFHRVLLDPPCSAEGTYRLHSRFAPATTPQAVGRLSGLQRALLDRALDLLEPEGRLLYCTCTYAPEENEAVINDAIARGRAEILPINITLPHSPGITRWNGAHYHDQLKMTVRLYPHQVDSRGFFIAQLRRR